MKKILFLVLSILLLWSVRCEATTYYVDGLTGGDLTECDGLTDAAWDTVVDGEVAGCQLSHYNWVLAPQGSSNPTLLASGDTVIIDGDDGASGQLEYKLGYGSPNTSDGACHSSWSYDCWNRTVPSGADTNNKTKIYGKGWDTGCANPPQFYGVEKLNWMMKIGDFVDIRCLEITDHVKCIGEISGHPNTCDNSYPYGDWAKRGISNWGGSEDIVLKDLNIHGFAYEGLNVAGVNGLTLNDVYVDGNGWAGWDFDASGGPTNAGDLVFDNIKVRFNGCPEGYPITATNRSTEELAKDMSNCVNDGQAGYGDGFGTPQTGGNWVFTNSEFSYNTNDGLDLLYIRNTGTSTVRTSKFMGNIGNQVKISGAAIAENNLIIGNCGWLKANGYTWSGINNCRSGGDSVFFTIREPGQTFEFHGNTSVSNGGYHIGINNGGVTCDGSETFKLNNNIFLSGTKDIDTGTTDLDYTAELTNCFDELKPDYGSTNSNIAFNILNDPCTSDPNGFTCPSVDPEMIGITISGAGANYVLDNNWAPDARLTDGTSPPVGIGTTALVNGLDITGASRSSPYDAGAYEQSTVAADCDTDCTLCTTNQAQCEASAITCYWWTTSLCKSTPESVCDIDHCNLCATQSPCETATCTWNGSSCETPQPPGTGSTFTGGCNLKAGTYK